jgi:hypothetical protein
VLANNYEEGCEMSIFGYENNLIESVCNHAADVTKRDGVPAIGSDEIRRHHHREDGVDYPNDIRAASFRMGQTGYTLVICPQVDTENTHVVARETYLTGGDPTRFSGSINGIAQGLAAVIDREQRYLKRQKGLKHYPEYQHQATAKFEQAASDKISRQQAIAARLVEVHEKLGLDVPANLRVLVPVKNAALSSGPEAPAV